MRGLTPGLPAASTLAVEPSPRLLPTVAATELLGPFAMWAWWTVNASPAPVKVLSGAGGGGAVAGLGGASVGGWP
jgi:hypothetical protein